MIQAGQIVGTETEDLTLRWHTQGQFHALLKDAGFENVQCVRDYSQEPASEKDCEFTFVATK